jgi:hypothetical protein
MQNEPQKKSISMRDLYPHLEEAQLKEAEENFQRYLEIARRTFERINSDSNTVDNPDFDSLER